MDGGQKINIPLDSELDIKSSDMLVPVDKPKFQHNRQKFQGRYLPSSVRFEHDGYAAGNDVYEFDISEAEIKIGDFTIIRKNLNDNPTYELRLLDMDRNVLATLIYNAVNRVRDYTVDSCEIVDGHIQGTFNNKPFNFVYDKDNINSTPVEDAGNSPDILLDEYNMLAGYLSRIKIYDEAARIQLYFSGIVLPTNEIYNGRYLFGKFLRFIEGVSNWQCGSYTFIFDTSGSTPSMSVVDSAGNALELTDVSITAIPDSDEYHISFNTDLEQSVGLFTTWHKVFPFFKHVDVTAPKSNFLIDYAADDKIKYNRWGCSIINKEAVPGSTPDENKHILYKNNYVSGNVTHSDSNSKIIKHIIPVWIGISNLRFDTTFISDNNKVDTYTRSVDIDYIKGPATFHAGQIAVNSHATADSHYMVKYIEDTNVLDISGALWLGNKQSIISEGRYQQAVPVTARVKVINFDEVPDAKWNYSQDWFNSSTWYNDPDIIAIEHTAVLEFDLPTTGNTAEWYIPFINSEGTVSQYKNMLNEFIQATRRTTSYLIWIERVTIYNLTNIYNIAADSDLARFFDLSSARNQGSIQYGVAFDMSYSLGAKFSVKNISDATNITREIVQLDVDTPVIKSCISESTQIIDGGIYWAACSVGCLLSEISIASNKVLTDELDATDFTLTPVPDASYATYGMSQYANLSSIFRHRLDSASCDGNLNISINLCSIDDIMYLYYTRMGDSTDNPDYTNEIPPHIRYNTLDSSQYEDASPLKFIAIRPGYDTKEARNADTNLCVMVIGEAAKLNENNFFRCIENIDDKLNASNLLPGNNFTEELLPKFVEDSYFNVSDFTWWIDITQAYTTDAGYIKNSTGQTVSMHTAVNPSYTFTYDILTNNISQVSVNQFMYRGTVIKVTGISYNAQEDNYYISYAVPVSYSFDAQVPATIDPAMILVIFENNIATVDTIYNGRYLRLTLDFDMRQVTVSESYDQGAIYTVPRDCEETWSSYYAVDILYDGSAIVSAVLEGIHSFNNFSSAQYLSDVIRTIYDGQTFDIPKVMGASGIGCFYTNITKPVLDRVQFAELKTDAELQFLRQQWETNTTVENFWWLDSTHILVLTRDEFHLMQKTNTLDDWGGDVFEKIHEWKRSDLIDSRTQEYFCSSANNDSAKLICVSYTSGTVYIDIYDPLLEELMIDEKIRVYVGTSVHDINTGGTYLNVPNTENTALLNMFSRIATDILITQSKWTATCIGGYLIIGIHYDNNFNQWAIVVSLLSGNIIRVIQGYGFVGVDGSLTGGEIPTKYFDPYIGFIGRIEPLDALKQEGDNFNIKSIDTLWDTTARIVGTAEQQWYIDKDITSIVSHLKYIGSGQFEAVELKLNNNYSVNYDSASYASSVLSDTLPNAEPVEKAFPVNNSQWTTMLYTWAYPIIYYFAPKISVMNYLQQTIGQAAYVHYNSTSIVQQNDATKNERIANEHLDIGNNERSQNTSVLKPVNDSELSFDVQSVKQEQSIDDPYSTILTLCAAALGSLRDWAIDNIQYDKDSKQVTVDFDKKNWSEYFELNMNSAKLSNVSTQSLYSTQTSEVTALKTLDMFYSTCDKQQICAGRGYVNHNFVAQCVVQSVESIQIKMLQQKFTFVMKELTLLSLEIIYKALDSLRKALYSQVVASGGSSDVGVGLFVLFTIPVSIPLAIAYAVADVACNYIEIGRSFINALLETLGGGKLQSSVTATNNHGERNVEAKHKYGSRSESFMWPCFGIDTPQRITNEAVDVVMQNKPWKLDLPTKEPISQSIYLQPEFSTVKISDTIRDKFEGDVPYFVAMVKGKHTTTVLPERMAYVIGTESFLPASDFKNRAIGESEPVFPTPPFQDYIIDERWQLAQTASAGMTTWVSCRDTKLIDGEFSNIVVTDSFCGVASPYTAIEVRRGIDKKYIRPWAITPNIIAINNTGLNCVYEEKMYHAFDGYGSRIVNWEGSPGLGKEKQTLQYAFLVNDRFKRSNKLPPNEFLGNFKGDPTVAIHGDSNDKVFVLATQPGENSGLITGTVGEDKDIRRYSLPIFSEYVNTMPAAVKTVAVQMLSVIDGITSLTTENRDLQTAYKAPMSVDFTIGKNKYRYTPEYICQVTQSRGVTLVSELVPCLGLTYLGSTPYEAYLYSQAERQYYVFSGSSALRKVDTIERFRNIVNGRYDFVNQEIILPCIATFLRLDRQVKDDTDETDNTMIARLSDNKFIGEIQPPLDTIYCTRSGFRTISVPSGIAFQGPNRCIINRFVFSDYMVNQVKANYGKWKRVPREEYHPFRTYKAKYERVDETIGDKVEVQGWTHNPFLLVTAPLGIEESTDCMFEWEITFCWPVEMDMLYGPDNYAVVNIQAETMTPGGKIIADRPAHIFLTKELFTRTGNYGYYSFRYQSKCGLGNRERLHIWSDQYICISSLNLEYKPVTQRRTEILTQQVDIQRLTEI